MKSPLTELAAAAVLIIACLIGLFFWKSTSSGIALAEVLERIEQIKAYSCQMNSSFKSKDVDEMPISQAKILISKIFGLKISFEKHNPITEQSMLQEIYVLPPKRAITILMHNEKKYSKMKYDEAYFEGWQEETDPQFLVKQILKCEHKSIGRSTIDGNEVESFQTITDPNYIHSSMDSSDIKIWVDVEKKLPVRIEIDKSGKNKEHVHIVVNNFQWDVPVDAADFEPVIPDDYTPGQHQYYR